MISALQQAWTHRMNGRIGEALALHAELSNINLPPREQAELLLLEASFLRHELQLEQSALKIAAARSLLNGAGLKSCFQMAFQSALNADAQSRFADSLRLYQEAARIAESENERLLAKYNLAICQYNLNLPNEKVLAEIQNLLEKTPEHPFQQGFQQIQLMQIESAFLSGDFAAVFRIRTNDYSQGLYQQALIQSLPWGVGKESTARERLLEQASTSNQCFQQNYCLQTILADPRFLEESLESTLQLKADRLFLWTWLWLDKPSAQRAKLLQLELNRFPFDEAYLTMTSADFYLLRSAGLWLSLYDANFARFFHSWLEKSTPVTLPPAPLFDKDLEDIESARRRLQASPLVSGTLTLRKDDFTLSNGERKIVSEPCLKLLWALKEHRSINFEDALCTAFGITGYDSMDHGPKIHNLVQRLKALLPDAAKISTKGQRLYLEDPKNKIFLDAGSPHVQFFPVFAPVVLKKKQTARYEKRVEVDQQLLLIEYFCEENTFSRQQIQERLGLSKPTTNRWINRWVATQVLEKTGNGREIQYRLVRFDSPTATHKYSSRKKSCRL